MEDRAVVAVARRFPARQSEHHILETRRPAGEWSSIGGAGPAQSDVLRQQLRVAKDHVGGASTSPRA
jgi:hypothetical protein